jgi:hypothetical protein
MSFEDHVSLQAQAWEIPNEPRLLEKDLKIAALEFEMADESVLPMSADENDEINMAVRLCIQSHASSPSSTGRLSYLPFNEKTCPPIRAFFTEQQWFDDETLRALRNATGARIIWK